MHLSEIEIRVKALEAAVGIHSGPNGYPPEAVEDAEAFYDFLKDGPRTKKDEDPDEGEGSPSTLLSGFDAQHYDYLSAGCVNRQGEFFVVL